ncbi:hypothetical protein [Streptomyces sp. NEAU-YJ-81]|uniref:hypothetical protein n=1 Tax=Streptomyces sp. NEAU-YJ-81 TaxID=2820288 RepID=UPI001ABC0021|nr:hypothetical protein [Streptomyces sp. NEAU-YJ-81]MBO3674865.1 hypothetical protein [Streptomyces sp. NEAU-YJ-81]
MSETNTFRAIDAGAAQSVADTASRFLSEFSAAAPRGYEMGADIRGLVNNLTNTVSGTISLAAQAGRESAAILADDTLYPEGRSRLAREAKESARAKVAEADAAFDVKYTVAEAALYQAARPVVPKAETASARMDAQMLLDGALNRKDVSISRVLQRLAGRQDAVGALVSSDWLEDYAVARGIDTEILEPAKVLIQHSALEGAAKSGDPERSAAARAALALRSLRQAQTSARAFARLTLGR